MAKKTKRIGILTAGGTAKHKASNMLKIQVVGSMAYR